MEQETEKTFGKEALLMAVAGVLLSRLSLGNFIFTLPVLFLAPGIKKTSNAVGLIVLVGLIVMGWNIYDNREVLAYHEYYGVLGFSLFFPLCLTVIAAFWTGLRNYSRIALRKLVICSIPVLAIGLAYTLWLSSEGGNQSLSYLQGFVKGIMPTEFGLQLDIDLIVDIFTTFILVAMAPMGMAFGSIPVLISEFVLHKNDEGWQNDFSSMSMPQYYFWITMVFWIAGLLSSVVDIEYPVWLTIVVWNVSFCLLLHYFIAGVSIISARARKKIPEAKASKICWICMVMCLIPGANFVMLLGLPVLGLLETWINLR